MVCKLSKKVLGPIPGPGLFLGGVSMFSSYFCVFVDDVSDVKALEDLSPESVAPLGFSSLFSHPGREFTVLVHTVKKKQASHVILVLEKLFSKQHHISG